MAGLQTEFEFVLPKGLVDEDGTVHREGTMRLATARDELEPLGDPKVKDADDPFLTIIVMARVITGLGTRTRLSPKDVEGMFAADLAYLQDLYSIINFGTEEEIAALTASVDAAKRGARSYAPSAAAVPVVTAQPVAPAAVAPDADVASVPAQEPTRAAPRRPAAKAVAAAVVDASGSDADGPDGPGPELDEHGMEIPTNTRRGRIEEVGKSADRPKGAR
jgi:hypothetical protein